MNKPQVIRVPKPKKKSYRPHRPLQQNSLLQNQVKHFLAVEQELPPEHQTGIALDSIQTEHEAAEYIRRMTEKLHSLNGRHKP